MEKKNEKQARFLKRYVTSLFVLLGADDPDVGGFVRVCHGLVMGSTPLNDVHIRTWRSLGRPGTTFVHCQINERICRYPQHVNGCLSTYVTKRLAAERVGIWPYVRMMT